MLLDDGSQPRYRAFVITFRLQGMMAKEQGKNMVLNGANDTDKSCKHATEPARHKYLNRNRVPKKRSVCHVIGEVTRRRNGVRETVDGESDGIRQQLGQVVRRRRCMLTGICQNSLERRYWSRFAIILTDLDIDPIPFRMITSVLYANRNCPKEFGTRTSTSIIKFVFRCAARIFIIRRQCQTSSCADRVGSSNCSQET